MTKMMIQVIKKKTNKMTEAKLTCNKLMGTTVEDEEVAEDAEDVVLVPEANYAR